MSDGVNIPLLRKAVEWAEAEAAKPTGGQWNQWAWAVGVPSGEAVDETYQTISCGTSFCVAGWACHEAGDRFLVNAEYGHLDEVDAGYVLTQDGRVHDVETRAADLLNISEVAAGSLFACANTIEDVRRIAEEIAGERL